MLVLQSQQMVTHHSLVLLLQFNSKVVVLVLVLDQQLIIHSLVKKLDMDLHSSNSLGQESQQSMLIQELDTLVLLLSLFKVVVDLV